MTDWNDVFVEQGAGAVRDQLREQLQEPAAIAQLDSGYNTHWEMQLLRNKQGAITNTMRNVALILQNRSEWAGVLAYCEFSYRIYKRKAPPVPRGRIGEWENVDTLLLKDWLGQHYELSPSNNDIDDAVLMVAKGHSYHPVREYLQGLVWDGKPRLNHWLSDILEADGESEYLAAVGRKFLIGAVARVMRPPVKMDNVLILEGKQGEGKSTLVRVLFNDWYSESTFDIGMKDGYQHIQGVWGVELPELDSLNKAESTAAKSFFTALTDRFRPPYGRQMEEFARQCVFVGTTNQDEYLKDYSGNRRYWPVYCNKVDIQMLKDCRDQLWAEAMHLFNQGDPWWVDGEEAEIFKKHQDRRMLDDPWESLIADWLDHRDQSFNLNGKPRIYFTSAEILIGACRRDAGHIQRADQNRIAPIMKFLGWHSTRKRIREDGDTEARQVRVYVRPNSKEAF
jgi:putative DNA primase/helicase